MNQVPTLLSPMPEDWRILRALGLYRLLITLLLIILFNLGVLSELFAGFDGSFFHKICLGYALAGLFLLLPVFKRRPRIGIQAPLHFTVDALAIASLVYASGGIGAGLGILLLTPAVGACVVLDTRLVLWQPLFAIVLLFFEEVLRTSGQGGSLNLSGLALLALILFGTTVAGNSVARRARRGEALAARVGSDLETLARLNQSIIDNLQTGVLIIDAQQRLRPLNDAALRLTGLKAGTELALGEAFPALASALGDWRANPHRDLDPLFPPSGSPELAPRLTRIGDGPTTTTLVLLDEASKLREQAQAMKVAALGRLSASIAHEIRNPLSAINQASQLLSESNALRGEDRRLLDMIERHCARIDKIVRDVLSLTRKESTAAPQSFELSYWLRRAVELYGEGSPARRDRLRLSPMPADLWIRFDPSQLQQTLFNLWDNSFDHAGKPPEQVLISIRTGRLGGTDQPYIEISDNGPGIPPDVRDKVFEPFFTTRRTGSGLGLYLARELCEHNQARMEYLPRQSGACFRLIFAGTAEQNTLAPAFAALYPG